MVQADKRVLWHPRNNNKFVVGGNSQITLYEWAPEYPEIRTITSQHDLHHLKCFAWSPDPMFEDLLAVGSSTGKVDLIRLEANKQTRQRNVLSSGPTVTLPVRHSRSCNSLAFCTQDPNYLAVGLDKIRSDSSLMVWDISSSRAALTIPGLDPVQEQATTVLPSRPQPQIPRMDNRIDSRILQQHALTEVVSAVSFIPDSTHLLLAGISQRWLRLFDLRSSTPSIIQNVASKVHGIATDPFDDKRFACFGDNIVTVFDRRNLGQPLLNFSEKDAAADGARFRPNPVCVHVEFSKVRRGCLATLERDSSYIRFWDIAETRSWTSEGSVFGGSSDGEGKANREAAKASRRSWANLPWPTTHVQQPSPTATKPSDIPGTPDRSYHPLHLLSNTRRTKNFSRSLACFTTVPPNEQHPMATNVMVVNKDGSLELHQLHDTPVQSTWSSKGSFALSAGTGVKTIPGYHQDHQPRQESRHASTSNTRHPAPDQEYLSRLRTGQTLDASQHRGRAAKSGVPSSSTLFAGDEGAMPSLSGVSAQLAKSMGAPRKRAYSPASFRQFAKEAETPSRQTFPPPSTAQSRSRERSPGTGKRKVSGGRPSKSSKGHAHAIEEDISMIMRKRADQQYCLNNPLENARVVKDYHDPSDSSAMALARVWTWIQESRRILSVPPDSTSREPKIHGFDFSFQGILGIWDGFPPVVQQSALSVDDTPIAVQRSLLLDVPGSIGHHSLSANSNMPGFDRQPSRRSHSPADDLHGNWNAAIASLVDRKLSDRTSWKPSVQTAKIGQRQLALCLCSWNLQEDALRQDIKSWERSGKISKAACWLVFTRQYSRAMDVLMRSTDEMHRMMSGAIAALMPSSSASKSPELREHYSRLSVRLQDPYFRMIITHLGVGDWTEVLDEDVIDFKERLAIAFQFLDDRALTSYLHRIVADATQDGNIEALIVTGLTKAGIDILQAYVDRTGDVQTAAIMGAYVCPVKFQDRRVMKWFDAYQDLLDGFGMFKARVVFDIARGERLLSDDSNITTHDVVPPQILIRCNYCNKPVNSAEVLSMRSNQKVRPTVCPSCSRGLPRCSICLMTLGIVDDVSRELDLADTRLKDTIEDAIVICQTCRHGGHANHILEWFLGQDGHRAHGVCPVANCNCRCADEYRDSSTNLYIS